MVNEMRGHRIRSRQKKGPQQPNHQMEKKINDSGREKKRSRNTKKEIFYFCAMKMSAPERQREREREWGD